MVVVIGFGFVMRLRGGVREWVRHGCGQRGGSEDKAKGGAKGKWVGIHLECYPSHREKDVDVPIVMLCCYAYI